MTYPAGYEWLGTVGPLPRTVQEGLKLCGTVEVPGERSSPVIMAWVKELNNAGIAVHGYSSDAVPWCGLFAAIVAHRAGKKVPDGPLWAKNWRAFGKPSPAGPMLGDVLVFNRPGGGGHVGFYIAADASAYHVLGGNQGDKVSIARIAKSRCIAARRPSYNVQPASVKAYACFFGGKLSGNEA